MREVVKCAIALHRRRCVLLQSLFVFMNVGRCFLQEGVGETHGVRTHTVQVGLWQE